MAKRTNKTDHVLNLISSGSTKHNSESGDVDTGVLTPPPVDPLANSNPQVSIVQSSAKEEKAVAETIRNSLEKELEVAVEQKSETLSNISDVEEHEVVEAVDAILDMVDEVHSDKPADKETVVVKPAAEEKNTEQNSSKPKPEEAAKPEEPIKESQIYENRFQKELEERIKEPAPEFSFVNVMEYLVRDKVINYMEQFGNCTCGRCVEDTAALTLTHLPAKYVVVNKNAISPLLDYYGHKFAGQITVEITKSCIKVNKFPHHGRE